MKLLLIITLFLISVFCFCREPAPKTQNSSNNQIIIKFKPSVSQSKIDSLAKNWGLVQLKDIPELNLRVYKIESTKSVDDVIQKCSKDSNIVYAEPNYPVKTLDGQKQP